MEMKQLTNSNIQSTHTERAGRR